MKQELLNFTKKCIIYLHHFDKKRITDEFHEAGNGFLEKIQRLSADLKNQKDQSPSNEEFLKLKAELHACTERLEKVEIASEKCSFCSFM